MCGIAGIFAYNKTAPSPRSDELLRIRDHMASRGPDGHGLYVDPNERLLLGHRRLSIIDITDASAQPMSSEDGDLVIVFNGEIYNYESLRNELRSQGVSFRSAGDTEVLLHLYARDGVRMVDRLEGMFAFAIWDRRKKQVLLARDPHGIKPLYYADDGKTLRFASSVRALMAGGAISKEVDPSAIVTFLSWGQIHEPHTIYRDIQALPAGTTVMITKRGMECPETFWKLSDVYDDPSRAGRWGRQATFDLVRDAVKRSMRAHLVADVPVGLFLSAGYDSTALLALASEVHDDPIHTVTLAFEQFRGTHADESPVAELVAERYGAKHTTVHLGFDQVRDGMPAFLQAMDQPTIDGLNTYWVSYAMRQAGIKAAMSGLGGDELFGGYPSFQRFGKLRTASRFPCPRVMGKLVKLYGGPAPATTRGGKLLYLPEAIQSDETTFHLLRGMLNPQTSKKLAQRRPVERRRTTARDLPSAPSRLDRSQHPSVDPRSRGRTGALHEKPAAKRLGLGLDGPQSRSARAPGRPRAHRTGGTGPGLPGRRLEKDPAGPSAAKTPARSSNQEKKDRLQPPHGAMDQGNATRRQCTDAAAEAARSGPRNAASRAWEQIGKRERAVGPWVGGIGVGGVSRGRVS